MKTKILLKIFCLTLLLLFAWSGRAEKLTPRYVTIVKQSDQRVLFRSGFLGKNLYHLCRWTETDCEIIDEKKIDELSKKYFTDSPELLASKSAEQTKRRSLIKDTGATRIISSPDNQWLSYYLPAKLSGQQIRQHVLINTTTNQTWRQTYQVAYWDLLTEQLRLFAYSPDSQHLVYLDDRDGYPTLYLVKLKTGDNNKLLSGDRLISKKYSVADFIFADNDKIFFTANRDGTHHWSLYQYELSNGQLSKLAEQCSYGQYLEMVNGRLLFWSISNSSVAPRLYDPATGQISNFRGLANYQQDIFTNQREELTLKNLPAVLIKPKNFNPKQTYPLLIWLHGGPYRQTSLDLHSYESYGAYDWLLETVAQAGVVVLKLDYRGSYGYGRDFATSIKNQVGQADVAEVETALTELKRRYRLGKSYLIGNSYGGYLAMRTLVEKPTNWSGAMTINGVADWAKLLKKLNNSIFNIHFNGLPDKHNQKLYQQADIQSRITRLGQQKIYVIQGKDDRTIPEEQALTMTELLAEKGKNVLLYHYAGEDHVFENRQTILETCQNLFDLVGLTSQADNCQL